MVVFTRSHCRNNREVRDDTQKQYFDKKSDDLEREKKEDDFVLD